MLKGERTRLQRYAIESTPARVYEGCCTWFTILVLSARLTDYQAVRNITPALTPNFGQWSGLFFTPSGFGADGLILFYRLLPFQFVQFIHIDPNSPSNVAKCRFVIGVLGPHGRRLTMA